MYNRDHVNSYYAETLELIVCLPFSNDDPSNLPIIGRGYIKGVQPLYRC